MPSLFAGNGSTYAIKVSELKKYKNFVPPTKVYPYEMPIWKSLDIDTKDDYEYSSCRVSYLVRHHEILFNTHFACQERCCV